MKIRKWISAALILLLLLSLVGCGAATEANYSKNDMMAETTYGVSFDKGSSISGEESVTAAVLPENRKLIRTVHMDVETEEMELLLAQVDEKIAALAGYVESREVRNGSTQAVYRYRSAALTIRIPAAQLDSFIDHMGGVSNVVSSQEYTDDITLTYVATDSRVKALEAEEERLLALMEQAENMSDLLEIEARLTDVRYELERMASQLRTYDNQVDYATVHLEISEVREYTQVEEQTVWQRIATGFVDSLKQVGNGFVEFFVWILVNLPQLVLWAGVLTGVFFLARRLIRKRRRKKTPPQEQA